MAPGPILLLISAAMVMKACSTLVALLALVSRDGMLRESANSCDTEDNRPISAESFVQDLNETNAFMLIQCSCGSVVEHCVSSTKGCGFNSQGTHVLIINV